MGEFLAPLEQHTFMFLLYSGILGLLIGSFLNVVILRLPPQMAWQWKREATDYLELQDLGETREEAPPGIAKKRSGCPKCGHQLSWWENIPLISYLLLRGKCRSCKAHISLQYPLVEALTGGLFILAAFMLGVSWMTVAVWAFCSLLVAAAIIDLRTTLLPDILVYPMLWVGLTVSAIGLTGAIEPSQAIIGALLGYLSLWSVYWLFKIVRGKEGMGYGDFKLLAALGAWCGPSALLSIVLVSTILGALIGGLALVIQGKDKATPFPFGPFLAVAGLLEFFWRGGLLGLAGI